MIDIPLYIASHHDSFVFSPCKFQISVFNPGSAYFDNSLTSMQQYNNSNHAYIPVPKVVIGTTTIFMYLVPCKQVTII